MCRSKTDFLSNTEAIFRGSQDAEGLGIHLSLDLALVQYVSQSACALTLYLTDYRLPQMPSASVLDGAFGCQLNITHPPSYFPLRPLENPTARSDCAENNRIGGICGLYIIHLGEFSLRGQCQ